MFGTTGRRAFEILVGLFALLGFVCVPLGQKTGFEHLRAIAATGPAREAGRDVVQALVWARNRLLGGPATDATSGREGLHEQPSQPEPNVPELGSR